MTIKLITQSILEIRGPNPINIISEDIDQIDWLNIELIPTIDLEAKIAELEALQYQLDRVTGTEEQPLKYAPKGDQLDQIYHAIDSGLFGEDAKTSDFYLDNKAVKEAHDKP